MSKTVKAVVITAAIFLLCVISVAVVLSVTARGEGGVWIWSNLIGGEEFVIEETEDFDLDGVKEVKIDCASGDVQLIAADETKAILTGTAVSSKRLDQYLNVYREGDTLVVKVKHQTGFFTFYSGSMDLDVYLPVDNMLDLTVISSSGNLLVPEFAFGDVDINKTSGDATISAVSADTMDYQLSSGNTDIIGCQIGDITINSTSGNIEIEDTTGNIFIRSTSGRTEIMDAQGEIDIGCTSGNVSVTMANSEIQPISIGITSGNAQLYMESDTAFDFEAKTTSGNVSSEIEVSVAGSLGGSLVGDSVEGTANGGGPLVYMEITSGNICIVEK